VRGDQEHGAGAQQRRNDRSLQRQTPGERNLRKKCRQPEGDGDARDGEPGQAAAARLQQHETGENGSWHVFICRLVAGSR